MNHLTVISLALLIAFASARSLDFEDDRIVNGEDAAIGQFPHQVSLRLKGRNRHFCGGTIINSRFILTAAHCSYPYAKPITVAGTIKLSKGGKVYNIAKIIPHPLYQRNNDTNFRNDIALWRTTEEIEFDENVQPAALPNEDTEADVPLTVSGWGRTSYPPPPGDSIPNHLQFLNTTSLSVTKCKNAFRYIPELYYGNDFDKLVCVLKPGSGACHGDSGGPLINENKVVVGVVSWGMPCAEGYPDGFTRVYSFLDWINKIVSAKYDD